MKAIGFAGLVALLLASSVMGANTVIWSSRAIAFDGDGNPIDMGAPINPADYPSGVWLQWDVYCDVTGDNQGLFGAVVSMGVKEVSAPMGVWAPVHQDDENLAQPQVFKAPGVGVNGSVADDASAGGVGAGKGAAKGWAAPGDVFFVDQMGMGYLDWSPWRYKTTVPKGWIGKQQWGVGLASRKAAILRDGVDGYYDIGEGYIDISSLPPGTYRSVIVLNDQDGRPITTSSVINSGQNLNTDLPSLEATVVTPAGTGGNLLTTGDYFEFTIVPEPATLLLLAGAALLYRRRRA